MTFKNYPLGEKILLALEKMGYEEATGIQQQAIPLILEGHDLIALAETGSGKTAACAIPVSHRVNEKQKTVQALIIVPTRELCLQYAVETQKIGKYKHVKAYALFGGEDYSRQEAKLKAGVQVLVATPGRLIDFIYSRRIDLTQVETLILDEADQMLSLGFYEDLEFIMQCLIHEHQTLLFSATMPKEISALAKHHMNSPKEVSLISKKPTPKKIDHLLYEVKNYRERHRELLVLLTKLPIKQAIVFANSRKEVEEVARLLKGKLSYVDFLHGGLSQDLRSRITDKFRRGKIHLLVATDVAARGLDFSGVTHVVHSHLPKDLDTYLHRAGRTGRAGREGTSITLVTKRDSNKVKMLFKKLKKPIKWIEK